MSTTGDLPVVRLACVADAEDLARCQLTCWREAYTGLVQPDRLAALVADVDEAVQRWQRILGEFPGQLVADHDGAVVGFAGAGPGRDPDLDLTRQLYALYVRQVWWGRGLGHRLLQAALGDEDAYLWVFRDNPRARRCYARHGFVPDGAEAVDERFGGVEIRMVRRRGDDAR